MAHETNSKFLFLIDDGWRYEKREVLYHLKEQLSFDIATHDEMTSQVLGEDFCVWKIKRYSLRRNPLYAFLMFFARELDTALVKNRFRRTFHAASLPMKVLYLIRIALGKLKLRPYGYCRVLEWLYRGSNKYADILDNYDALVFVPVAVMDKRLIYEARHAGLKIICWVYSWDNPMKDNEFMPNADRYLVWNEECREDLHAIHGIPRERVDIAGPVQFDYILERSGEPSPSRERPYVLYACALGQDCHLDQELNTIIQIRRIMDDIDPDMLLMVRPYPFRKHHVGGEYDRLKEYGNIDVFDYGDIQEARLLLSEKDLVDRYEQLRNAECFINMGSTIGLEASFTKAPILQLAFTFDYKVSHHHDIRHLLKNDHMKYFLREGYPNVVANEGALKAALEDILSGDKEPYMAYSKALQAFANPLETSSYKGVFREALRRAVTGK